VNVFLGVQGAKMPKEAKLRPIQQFIGLQVIDTKGTLVGNVKDMSLDFENKEISLKVATKDEGERDFGWEDIQSVEDVVLLKKQVDLTPISKEAEQVSAEAHAVQTLLICPSCGASSPARAKFCSKCGFDLKS
jgi:sporulation protein YlmC with PRC-barrel domain/ribosomal protein L40E